MAGPRRSIPVVALAALAAGAAPAPAATAPGTPALLIDSELRTASVRVVGIDADRLRLLDEFDNAMAMDLGSVVALLPSSGPVDAGAGVGASVSGGSVSMEALRARLTGMETGLLELVDGQRFPGALAEGGGETDAVTWTHPVFGDLRVELDRILRAANEGAASMLLGLERVALEDAVRLRNGDTLTGFIVGFSGPVVIETASGEVSLGADRVAVGLFANPEEALGGAVVWLDDGTVARVASVTSGQGERVSATLVGGASGEYEAARVRAVGFSMDRLVALSSLEPESQEPVGSRPAARPVALRQHPDDALLNLSAALEAMDVEFPGPMRVVWELPLGATRFAATAALAETAASWGDCVLTIEVDGEQVFTRRLHGGEREASINVPVDGRRLSVTIDPGRYGPIRDRVVLSRPMILLGEGAAGE